MHYSDEVNDSQILLPLRYSLVSYICIQAYIIVYVHWCVAHVSDYIISYKIGRFLVLSYR